MARALTYLIEKLEYHRFPVKVTFNFHRVFKAQGLFAHRHESFIRDTLKGNQMYYEVRDLFDSFEEEYRRGLLRPKGLFVLGVLWILCYIVINAILLFFLFLRIYVKNLLGAIPTVILGVILSLLIVTSFTFITWFFAIGGFANAVARKRKGEIKKTIQKAIFYLRDYLKNNNLPPHEFQMRLRHNDYEGLRYEEKGKNKYIAYVVVG
jgi:hypothetical protein